MKTLLILEDDLDLGGHWRTVLEATGHRVIHESTARGAISVLDEMPVALLVTDMLIEGPPPAETAEAAGAPRRVEGGLTVLTHVRLNLRPPPKMMVVTGASAEIHFERYIEMYGIDRFLFKPVDDAQLLNEVRRLLADLY